MHQSIAECSRELPEQSLTDTTTTWTISSPGDDQRLSHGTEYPVINALFSHVRYESYVQYRSNLKPTKLIALTEPDGPNDFS